MGGVAIGMFHLITHAFFKALLFLGAGSVIHGSDGEQDIRRMGGLGNLMPITFVAYACGMLALSGFPLFSGFWSKDEILHSAFGWSISRAPFYMAAVGALLTAFYMTRQVYYVFAGDSRRRQPVVDDSYELGTYHHAHTPHESPSVMTLPLIILAVFAVGFGFVGTAVWPWFQSFLGGEPLGFHWSALADVAPVMISSSLLVITGLAAGWVFYGRKRIVEAEALDVLEEAQPTVFNLFAQAFYVDDFYRATIVRLTAALALACDWLDRWVWGGAVRAVTDSVLGLALLDDLVDRYVVNAGFDETCKTVSGSARTFSQLQGGRVQSYLRMIGVALIVLAVLLFWGIKA
jgi:NADH-quinone oxidoreductase subunit L